MNHNIADLTALLAPSTAPVDAKTRRAGYWGATVSLQAYDRAKGIGYRGSGVLLSASGYLITNFHVTDHGIREVTVRLHGDLEGDQGYTLSLDKLLCKHASYDLMLARCVVPKNLEQRLRASLPPIALAHKTPELGAQVRVYGFKEEVVEERVGRVLGKEGLARRTRTGEVRYAVGTPDFLRNKKEVTWYTDAEIELGFSGGPVVDAATGELLGITWAMIGAPDEKVWDHSYISAEGIRRVVRAYVNATNGVQEPSAPQKGWVGKLQDMVSRLRV